MERDLRWLLVPVLVVGVTFLACHGFAEAQQKPISLTYSHFFVTADAQAQLAEAWSKEIEKRSNGKVKITYYPEGKLL